MVEMIEAKNPCVDCGGIIMRPKTRGRPPTRCEECKGKYELGKASEKANKVDKTSNRPPQFNVEIKLWKGKDLVCTRQDLPKGSEAQCPLCMRIFSSDYACELHKPYREPKSAHCKTPKSLGMIAIERRGLPIWTTKSEE